MAAVTGAEPQYIILENGLQVPYMPEIAKRFASDSPMSYLDYLTESLKAGKEVHYAN